MNSGMYAALSGSITAVRRLEVTSNNLANATTPGFKADELRFESVLADVQKPSTEPIYATEREFTHFNAGTLQRSGNVLDLALAGDGFFVVNTPQGPAYTREGSFHIGANRRLVNADGLEVQGQKGPITLSGNKIEIGPKGVVTVDGVEVDTLAVVDFPKPYQLAKAGGNLFQTANGPPVQSSAEVKQGYLETSNVKVMMEMARMIETNRDFEILGKVIKSYDEIAARAANELGKV